VNADATQNSRAVALRFVEFFSTGRIDAALDLLADDLIWWVAGDPGRYAPAGSYRKADLPGLFAWIGATLPQGVSVQVTGITAENERVALEVEAQGVSAAGGLYHNHIHFLFEVRSGKIVRVREYLDTLHARDVLIGLD